VKQVFQISWHSEAINTKENHYCFSNLATFAEVNYGRHGNNDGGLAVQITVSIVGRTDGVAIALKGFVKGRFL